MAKENNPRYIANKQILEQLETLVELCPDQRFGQIICNYIFPNYREEDPFFEESALTQQRIKGMLQEW